MAQHNRGNWENARRNYAYYACVTNVYKTKSLCTQYLFSSKNYTILQLFLSEAKTLSLNICQYFPDLALLCVFKVSKRFSMIWLILSKTFCALMMSLLIPDQPKNENTGSYTGATIIFYQNVYSISINKIHIFMMFNLQNYNLKLITIY